MDIGASATCTAIAAACNLCRPTPTLHGYETPVCPGQPTLAEAGLDQAYTDAMNAAHAAYARCAMRLGRRLPLTAAAGTRVRAVFKMDFAEALYIAELRSGVAGHFSYRRVAWEMYRAVARRHPGAGRLYSHRRCECAGWSLLKSVVTNVCLLARLAPPASRIWLPSIHVYSGLYFSSFQSLHPLPSLLRDVDHCMPNFLRVCLRGQ